MAYSASKKGSKPMCTAKIPPRPCLFLLAALFLLAGCSPQYSMRVISETDGHAYPNDQYTYYIASSKKQNSDPTYQLLKQDVKAPCLKRASRSRKTATGARHSFPSITPPKHPQSTSPSKSRFTDKPGPSKRRTARMTRPRAAIPKPPRRPQPTGRSGMRMKPRKSRSATSSSI